MVHVNATGVRHVPIDSSFMILEFSAALEIPAELSAEELPYFFANQTRGA